jgi:transcriptional antiterminator
MITFCIHNCNHINNCDIMVIETVKNCHIRRDILSDIDLKKEIEKLREQLMCIVDNSGPDEALELSEKLDALIAEYQRTGGME